MRNVFLGLLFFNLLSCQGQQSVAKMKPEEFSEAIKKTGIQVFDVRTADEYNSGHIIHALQADWTNQSQFLDRVQHLDKSKPVYVYCLAGGRSNAAANWMRSNGFANVIELEGGINAWKAGSKPLEGKTEEPQITMEQYKASIPADKTTLVDFGAKWCPPCVKMAPVIDELRKSGEVDFNFINIDAGVHTNLMQELNISPIPVFIIYKEGKEIWRKQGIVSKEELLTQLK
jgi:rhodanese-related sulfurtransferase